nr:RING finger protein 112-like [Chrysemys picta bellii]
MENIFFVSLSASQMFIQVAKEVGETCNLPQIQRLDLLVRDWQLSGAYGADEGQEYLKDITQDLEVTAGQPLALGALRASGTQCYLLPHPGTRFTRSRAGTPGGKRPLFFPLAPCTAPPDPTPSCTAPTLKSQ